MSARWLRITSTSLDVSTDGEYLRWTLPVDAVEWLACELHPDGASRELYAALDAAAEQRRLRDLAEVVSLVFVTVREVEDEQRRPSDEQRRATWAQRVSSAASNADAVEHPPRVLHAPRTRSTSTSSTACGAG